MSPCVSIVNFELVSSGWVSILQNESRVTFDWFKKNEMIANLDKFQVTIIDKKKGDYTNKNKQIKSVHSVELLEIQLGNILNFS